MYEMIRYEAEDGGVEYALLIRHCQILSAEDELCLGQSS